MSPYFEMRGVPAPYWCPKCKAWYRVREPQMSCCVLHAAGDCCHEYEDRVEITPAQSSRPAGAGDAGDTAS